MKAEEAIAIVERRRADLEIADDMDVSDIELAIVAAVRLAGHSEDRVAWLVTLSNSCGLVRVDVDDRTGEVLEVRASA